MIPVTLTDLSLFLGRDFNAPEAATDQARILLFLNAAEALVTAASTPATDDDLAKLITLDVVRRAWLGFQSANPEYAQYSKTVGGVTESYTRASNSAGSSIFLSAEERAALRGGLSSSRARSVALGGIDLRSVLTSDGGAV